MFIRVTNTTVQILILSIQTIAYKIGVISTFKFGLMLARRIEKMDGIYIKIGQLLSVRPDLISFQIADELRPLLNNIKPIPFTEVLSAIRLHSKVSMDFYSAIDPIALGTGSIAQVHKVTLTNGRQCVVKVIRPNIVKYFNTDLRMLNFLMNLCNHIPLLKRMPVREIAVEIDSLMRQQLNLEIEGEYLEKFRQNFKHNHNVIIPIWYRELSSPELIILEYVPLPVAPDFENWSQQRRTETAEEALEMLYQMMFKDGLTHCDMHPGNFFISSEGKFILLDFGMVTQMEPSFRTEFIRFFFYMATNNGKRCAEIIEKTALHKSAWYKKEKFFNEMEQFIDAFYSMSAEHFSVLTFTKNLVRVQRRCGIKGATAFISNILAIAFFESHLKRIDPAIDFHAVATMYITCNLPEVFKIIAE